MRRRRLSELSDEECMAEARRLEVRGYAADLAAAGLQKEQEFLLTAPVEELRVALPDEAVDAVLQYRDELEGD